MGEVFIWIILDFLYKYIPSCYISILICIILCLFVILEYAAIQVIYAAGKNIKLASLLHNKVSKCHKCFWWQTEIRNEDAYNCYNIMYFATASTAIRSLHRTLLTRSRVLLNEIEIHFKKQFHKYDAWKS